MATNKYANESILYGSNDNIPYNLRGQNMIKDDLMNSVGLYSKRDIEAARFSKYSRFGRVLDPYGHGSSFGMPLSMLAWRRSMMLS